MITEWTQTKEIKSDPLKEKDFNIFIGNGIHFGLPEGCDISGFYTDRFEAIGYNGYYALWKDSLGNWSLYREIDNFIWYNFWSSFEAAKINVESMDREPYY